MVESVTFEDLRRIHDLAAERFPHEYLDVGLGAVGLFLDDPPKNAGYHSTPINSVTFAGTRVDGVHFGSVTDDLQVSPESPIVLTIPMALDAPNYIVGESLYDFLCLGCEHGFTELSNLHLNFDWTMDYYRNPVTNYYDQRTPEILRLLTNELSLKSWSDVRRHFSDLQTRFASTLRLPADD